MAGIFDLLREGEQPDGLSPRSDPPRAGSQNGGWLPALQRFFTTSLEDVYKGKYGIDSRMPTLSENVAVGIGSGLKALGAPKYFAEDFGRRTRDLLEWITPFGTLTAKEESARAAERGDILTAMLSGAGLIPNLGRAAGKVGDAVAKTFRHPISLTKLKRPLEEMNAIYSNERILKPDEIIWPERLQGGIIIPAVGDRTIAGKELAGINGYRFEQPVNLQGGFKLMRDNPDVWASEAGALSRLSDRIDWAGQAGVPVYLMYTSMGPRSLDYSRMMTEAIREQMKLAPVTKLAKTSFDADMRLRYPDFPGVDNLTDQWMAKPGDARTYLAQLMAQDRFQKLGFPDIASTRYALTEPELLNRLSGASGSAIAQVFPGAGINTKPLVPHPTYNATLPGIYLGSFMKPIPREIMFPNWAATRPVRENRAYADRSMLLGNVWQFADQQWLERIMNFLRSPEGQKYGIGGAVAAGLLTQEQAQQFFGLREGHPEGADGTSVNPET
ncbi:hypothetical protein [Mesorhizobium sp. 1B3]|uniref:hypothetical protein n=1 Tax=Mesorhizobium sp. 1B3 TaxID=3243599 RepID=UPI003D9763A4